MDCISNNCLDSLCTGSTAEASAVITRTSFWWFGYCANVTVTNTGSGEIHAWQVVLDMNNSTINNLWNGSMTQNASGVVVNNMPYNGTIPSDGSQSFGFCASINGLSYWPEVVSVTAF